MARVVIYKSTTPGQRAAIFKPGTNITFSENMVAGDLEVTVSSTGGGGGGAPTNASYLTLGTDATLTNERVFAHSTRLAHTDGGAGGSYTLDLNVSGVSAGSYTNASLTVDTYGRVTAASSGTAPVTSVSGTTGRVTSTGGTTPVLDLATAGTAGTYAYPSSVTTDAYGRVTSLSAGSAPVTSVSGTAGRTTSTGGPTPAIDLATAGTAGVYAYPTSVTTDAYGRVTSITGGSAPVTTTVTVDTGELTNTGTTTAAVLGLANAGTAGTYAYPSSMTTDAFGRVTSVTGGSAPVTTTVNVDAGELTNTGTTTAAVLGLANAGTAGTYSYPASMTTDAFGRVTSVTPGTAPISSHSSLSNLDWVNSGHTGLAYGVAAWNAAGAATVVNATSDETMLVRRGGVLQWVAIVAGVGIFAGDLVDDGTILYPNGIVIYTGSIL